MQVRRPDSITVAGRTVVPADTEEAYLDLARSVGRDGAPLPLLAEAWETFRTAVASLPTAAAATERYWQGQVFVCDRRFGAVGEVLARATGRPLRYAPFDEAVAASRRGPVTVVAGTSAITPEQFAAIPPDARLGLFVTRGVAAAGALAVRTVLHGPAAAADWGDLSFDVVALEASEDKRLVGLDVTPARLQGAIGDGVAMLSGRSHARDCVIHLNGGGICGRARTDPLLPVLPPVADSWMERPTACQQGHGCWRDDVAVDEHLRAAEIRAAFTVLDGCQLAVAGQGPVMADVSVPLTMLEGTAVAVACAIGIRKGAAPAGRLFQALMRTGLPLGEALAEVNGVIDTDPDALGRLALFGDAGLVPAPADRPDGPAGPGADGDAGVHVDDGEGAVLVRSWPVLPEHAEGPLVLPRADGASAWALTSAAGRGPGRVVPAPAGAERDWEARIQPWLRRLRALNSLGLQGDGAALDKIEDAALAALKDRAAACDLGAAQAAARGFEAAVDELTHYQSHLVAEEVRWISGNFYNFVDSWPRPWVARTDPDCRACPQCGAVTGAVHHIRPAAGTGPRLTFLVCARCGEAMAGSEDFPAQVVVRAPAQARRGAEFTVRVTVTATAGHPLTVSLGAAIANEQRLHCEVARCRDVELAPGESTTVEFTGVTDAERVKPDQKPLKVFLAADGAVRCLTSSLWIRA